LIYQTALLTAALLLSLLACSSSKQAPTPPPSRDEVRKADWFEHQSPLGVADAILWCQPFPSCEVSGTAITRTAFSTVPELAEILTAASFTGGVAIVLVSERNPEPFTHEEEQFLEAVIDRLRDQGLKPLGLFYFHPKSDSTQILRCRLTRRCS
jgi:hypothetical protein